jgi:hypothetical protein
MRSYIGNDGFDIPVFRYRTELELPLLTKRGRNYKKDTPLSLGSSLGDNDPRFDGFPQSDFIGQYHSPRQR